MPVARHTGTEADKKAYIGQLKAGGSKYDKQATENSEKHIDRLRSIRERLQQKLKDKRIQQVSE